MKETWALIKVELLNLFGINKFIHKKKHGVRRKLGVALALILAVAVAVVVYLCYVFKKYFNSVGIIKNEKAVTNFYATLLVGFSAFSLVTVILNVLGGFYKSKDMELTLSFPVGKLRVIIAKLIRLYALNVLVATVVALCSFYGLKKSDIDYRPDYFSVTASLLFVDCVPILVGFLIGTAIAYLCSFSRKVNLLQILSVGVILLLVFLLPKVFGENSSYIFVKAKNLFLKIQSTKLLCVYLAISLASVFITVLFVNGVFVGVRRALGNVKHAKRSKKALKTNGFFVSEIKRNVKRFFASSTYAINSLSGALVTVLLGVSCVFLKDIKSFDDEDMELARILFLCFSMFFTFISGVGNPSATAISMEGKTLWVIRSSPIKTGIYLLCKFLLGTIPACLSLTFAHIFISVFLFGKAVTSVVLVSAVTCFVLPIAYSAWGLLFNLFLPSFDWENEASVVKRSASAGFFTLSAFLLVIAQSVFIGTYNRYCKNGNVLYAHMIFYVCLTGILALSGVVALFTYGAKKFEKICG